MIKKRNGTTLLAIVATVVLLAGCKGESPTSPTNNPTPTPPGGSVTPPTGATVSLSVSKADPQVNSSSVITATVTVGGQPAPNGTAVEFTTDLGTFTEANAQTMIRTTTSGVATATLTSSAAGPANITATVNNVSAKTKVTFSAIPTQIPPPDLTPLISSVTPTIGRPQGGEVVTITGKNFVNPKVVFDFGGGKTVPGFIQSSSSTTIQVLTPSVDLGAGQQKTANIIVINNPGTPNEVTLTAGTPFTFQSEVLTPKITTVSPTSGPIDGGTRVTIFGEGFQAPIQIFFGSAEAQLASAVTFNQISVIAPAGSVTAPNGSGTVVGPVDIKIININSATQVTATAAFRYIAKMQITAFGPGAGSAFGGTQVEIDGAGFNDPLTVSIGTVAARVLSVLGSKVIAITTPTSSPCSPPSGPIVVTNIDNGDSATSTNNFTYVTEKPIITNVNPSSVVAGSPTSVTVARPGVGTGGSAVIRFTVNGRTAFPTPTTITDPFGPINFSVVTPTTGLTFPSVACTTGGGLTGTQLGPLSADIVFQNVTTGCNDTAAQSLTIQPPGANACVAAAPPSASVSPATFCPNGFGTTATGTPTSRAFLISNNNGAGGQALTYSTLITGPNAADFAIVPGTGSVNGGLSQATSITFTPSASGLRSATLTVTTNDPAHPTITVCLEGTGL